MKKMSKEIAMETTLTCAVCGMELKANWRKCPRCKTPAGAAAPESEPEAVKTVKCVCGAELEADWLTCPECGTDVEREAPPSSGNAGVGTEVAIMDKLFEKLKALLTAQDIDIDEGRITLAFSFRDVADSLDAYELLYAAEEEFGIRIPDEIAYKFKTVGDAYAFIKKELN
jgi:acyl carrier protein